jgi:hypothetical protein
VLACRWESISFTRLIEECTYPKSQHFTEIEKEKHSVTLSHKTSLPSVHKLSAREGLVSDISAEDRKKLLTFFYSAVQAPFV